MYRLVLVVGWKNTQLASYIRAIGADVAQLVEQLICNQPVVRSNRTVGSSLLFIEEGYPSG